MKIKKNFSSARVNAVLTSRMKKNRDVRIDIEKVLDIIGKAGEQAIADEKRYFFSYTKKQYTSSKHKGVDWREFSWGCINTKKDAMIVCYADVGSFLNIGRGYDEYMGWAGGIHHLRFEVYLVVKDSTSGERHTIRIPPRFGMYQSATVRRYKEDIEKGDCDCLVKEAVAWTFGLKGWQYHPHIQA